MKHSRAVESAGRDDECPLCSRRGAFIRLVGPAGRGFSLCPACHLIFTDRASLLSPEEEKRRYSTHRNGPQYPGYVRFLRQAIAPALPHLDAGMRGLDYGCGPGPTLSALLESEGLRCEDYDPFFRPQVPRGPFDFIFCTEVLEHLFHPRTELRRVRDLLAPHGLLVIMTTLWTAGQELSEWHYANDVTHVSFYSQTTIEFICSAYALTTTPSGNPRVTLLRGADS